MSLEKSLLLLDESISKSKRGLLRSKDAYQPIMRHFEDPSNFDMSLTMAPNEIRRFLDNTTLNANETTRIFNNSRLSLAGSQMSLTANTKLKTDQLYTQFLDILQSRTNDAEIFETVQDLIETLNDTIYDIVKMGKRSNDKYQMDDEIWLNHEKNTWKLLYCLYKDRLVPKDDMDVDGLTLVNSEKTIVEHIYETNSNLREYQLIVDWLEQTALEQSPIHVGHYTDRTVAWENTLHQLQNDGITVFGSNCNLVKSLDPDAPLREKRSLHDLDTEDQNRLSKQIFLEIRQGKIEDAQTLCEHCGQPWRAAILEGWRLHHDKNYETNNPTIKESIDGNPRRDLWKKCAWMLADNKKFDDYSRAIAGIFCGHLDSLLNVLTESWSDLLWAYLKVQIDIRVESEIRSYCVKSYLPMPDKYWNHKMSLEQIFEELSAHKNVVVKNSANDTVKIIQKYLILDDIPELMQHFDKWISDPTLSLLPQMLRFLTHIVLFIRQIGREHQESISDKVIQCYVECLIKMGNPQLVAFYTAALPSDSQTQLFSKFLETITESQTRKKCLEEAYNYGLDVPLITCITVENIRNQELEDANQQIGDISVLDNAKISSLEWLTFYPEQRGELLWQTNAMIRTFMAKNNVEAARKAFHMIPSDTIQHIINNFGSKDDLPWKEECSIKEYLCHQTYLAAIDGYNDWVDYYYNMKPKEPQFVKTSNFTERVASEHKEQSYRADLERWKIQLQKQTIVTRDLLYNLLLFPEKGWLVDPDTNRELSLVEENANRAFQMENLRKLCIPDVVLLLHKIFTLAGQHKECLQLVDVISSEQRQLFNVYSKHKLAEIMIKIAESSLALINEKNDPFVGDDAGNK